MDLSSIGSIYSSQLSSIYSASTASSTSFLDAMESTASSTTQNYDTIEISSEGRMASMPPRGPRPDFESMSTEDFREHLIEVQTQMANDGIDISSLNDPAEMTDEELDALKTEFMEGAGRGGRPEGPPPPPPSSSSIEEEAAATSTELIDTLLQALNNDDEDDDDYSVISAAYQQIVSNYLDNMDE